MLRCFCCVEVWSEVVVEYIALPTCLNFEEYHSISVMTLPDVNILIYEEKSQLTQNFFFFFLFTGERVLCFQGPLLYEKEKSVFFLEVNWNCWLDNTRFQWFIALVSYHFHRFSWIHIIFHMNPWKWLHKALLSCHSFYWPGKGSVVGKSIWRGR